jgi:hypothetical protein
MASTQVFEGIGSSSDVTGSMTSLVSSRSTGNWICVEMT